MIGTRLGSWILERELGRGGMGTVYLARRASPGDAGTDQAAVKVLPAHLAEDAGQLARFRREVEVLGKLSHPNIVRLYEAGEQERLHWYAMEYVEGRSFQALLHERSRLPWPEVIDMALQVCLALKHAHDHGIVHRDLKPSNLLRGRSASPTPNLHEGEGSPRGEPGHFGVVKLTDFGIAWVFASEHLTATGGIVGTAEYLSPEQAAGKQPTKRSDLYSLGAVLYALLTGRPPFEGEPLDLLHKHRYGQFDRPLRRVPDLPHDLDEVICELLEKEPEARPPDAAVLHKRLDGVRRKYERRANQHTAPGRASEETAAENRSERTSRTGPATLMARLMREELDTQNRGGPIKRFFNHPLVLIVLFVLSVGVIVYTFLPASAEKLYEQAAGLMSSEEPADWEEALTPLNKLRERYPDHRREVVEAWLRKAEDARDSRVASSHARFAGPMSEAHWFYEKGLRLRQQGKSEEARAVWRELVRAFENVAAEQPWVQRARRELTDPSGRERRGPQRWEPVRKALEQARQLEKEGKREEANQIRQALRALYAGDPSAREILDDE